MLAGTIILFLIPCILAGPDDTLDQLKVAFSNVPLADQVLGAEVKVESGEAPVWIEGSLVRHACGAFGETGSTSSMLNRVTHVFDCIEMGQSYSFHNGAVTFSHQFYDSNQAQIWKNYKEDMNQSSVWWGCVYADQNKTAQENEGSDMYAPERPPSVNSVSWWKVGKDVLAMSEHPTGDSIDVHHNKYLGAYQYDDEDWTDGWRSLQSPAHEQYDQNGKIWSSAGMFKEEEGIHHLKRVVFTLDPDTHRREIVGEFPYEDIDLRKCTGMGEVYPDPKGRLRNLHSFQMTENYIIIPETSYMYDPCTWIFHNDSISGWNQDFHFEATENARIAVMEKITGNFVAFIDVPAMFATHTLGAYEDPDFGLLHFDILQSKDASAYTKWSFVDLPLSGEELPDEQVQVTRYSLNMFPEWSLTEIKNLVRTPIKNAFEFSNINPAYQGKPYKFAYMINNFYNRHGSLVKLNVDDGTVREAEFPNGLFPTEPIFLASPNAVAEDDGVILMSGIDGVQEKGFLMVFNGTNLDLIYHATAPKLTLFGIHSKFFAFDTGCEQEDCTPDS